MTMGLPIVVPNIGCYRERSRGHPLAWVEPWDEGPQHWLQLFSSIRELALGATNEERRWVWREQPLPDSGGFLYRNNYLDGTPTSGPTTNVLDQAWLERVAASRSGQREEQAPSRRQKVLSSLAKYRRHPVGQKLARLIPKRVQSAIRCFLDKGPGGERPGPEI